MTQIDERMQSPGLLLWTHPVLSAIEQVFVVVLLELE